MKSANSVVLISSLLAGSNPEEKAKLSKLYKESFVETSEYKELYAFINGCIFDKGENNELFKSGKNAIATGMVDADSFIHTITEMQFTATKIKKELDKTMAHISSVDLNDGNVSVLKREDEAVVRGFYTKLLQKLCFMTASLYGTKYLSEVNVDINTSVFDFVDKVSTVCSKVLRAISDAALPRQWVIKRKKFGGANLVSYSGFELSYEQVDMRVISHIYPGGPFVYTPKAGIKNDVLCCGIGNIVVLDNANEFSLINSDVTIKLPIDFFDGQDIDYNNFDPEAIIRGKISSGACVINPEDFVERLNRYFMIQTVKQRQDAGICPYCGSKTCNNSHFVIPKDFQNIKADAN